MARRGDLRLAPTSFTMYLLLILLGCTLTAARPPSDVPTHHHHGHRDHPAHRAEKVETVDPPTPPPKSQEVGDFDQEDEEAMMNDADYYFGDDADLLTAAAGAVEAQLKAVEEAERLKAGTSTAAAGEDAADNSTSERLAAEGEFANNSPAKQFETRESSQEATHLPMRNKEMRLNNIKTTILQLLGKTEDNVNSNRSLPIATPVQRNIIAQLYERMTQVPQWPPTDLYTEKVQSFYPSCDVPRNTDEEAWHGPNQMNLLFNLTFPSTLDGSTISIVAAKLRLFKLAQGNVTSGTNPDGCPTPVLTPSPSPSTSTASETEQHSDALTVEVVPAADEPIVGPPASPLLGQQSSVLRISTTALQQDDRRIRVSVYWYTRSLKKHRSKRKLLDSQMVSIAGQEEWVEFDVRHAARVWREPNRNFGLVVEVEDEDGAVLPAERYFAAMNCSKEASTSRPFPGFLYDAAWETGGTNNRGSGGSGAGSKSPGGAVGAGVGGSRTLGLNTHLFPLMDLCTIQYPEGEEAPSLSLLPSLSSSSAFGLPFGRRPSISVPPSPPVVMVACGGAGTNTQRQIVPVIHPTGGRQRSNRRPEEKSGNNAKFNEERVTRRKGQEKDEDNDAVATNQLSQRRDEGDAPVDDPVVESPSAIQVTKIRHPRRHLESGHSHRSREGRWAVEKEKSETNKDGNEEEEEDEEMREEKVSWQDADGRQHVKRRVFVRKTIVSHKDGEGAKEGERVEEKDDGRSVTVMDHHGR